MSATAKIGFAEDGGRQDRGGDVVELGGGTVAQDRDHLALAAADETREAIEIIATSDEALADRIRAFRAKKAEEVEAASAKAIRS